MAIYRLPTLPYDYAALEPYIDARTMEIHYTKHHATYVNNLNNLLQGVDEFITRDLEEIVTEITLLPEEIRQGVRNNGGGHLNHSLFWEIMGPGRGGEPQGHLREAIDSTFGGFASFRERFSATASARFGSGWGWLGLDGRGKLELFSTPNQDSPFMLGYTPILGVDVWEHAYYLKYQNRRSDYLAAFWNVVNWEKVSELYAVRLTKLAVH